MPGYAAVYVVVRGIDPAMAVLAHEGTKRYKEVFDLVYCREAGSRTRSGMRITPCWTCGYSPVGKPVRPWLTQIEDDRSRAVAGYAVNFGAPSALTTALAFRQAIWRKPHSDWYRDPLIPDPASASTRTTAQPHCRPHANRQVAG